MKTGMKVYLDLAAALAEVERLRAERDKLIEACVFPSLSRKGMWVWDLGSRGSGVVLTKAEAIAAVRAAAGLPREEG